MYFTKKKHNAVAGHEYAKRRDIKLAFSSVYVDQRNGRFQMRKLGLFHMLIVKFDVVFV
jgi:hypothetical protein